MELRRVVVEIGADGRSRAADVDRPAGVFRFADRRGADPHDLGGGRVDDLAPAAPGELVVADLWRTGPEAPAGLDPSAGGEDFDIECPPGGSRWRLVEFGAGHDTPMHRTETVDHDLIVAGEIELELEEGRVTLRPGDTAVIPGLVHAWHTGEEACTMAVLQISLGRGNGDRGSMQSREEG